MKKGLLAIVLSGVLLSGCVISIDDDYDYNNDNHTSWSEIEKENREKISELSPGATISAVRRSMGTPAFDELIVKGDKEHRVLFYRTQRTEGDGITSKDECTPILFVDGKLIGFGETALNTI
ncbi:MAG: hypothetical protein ACJAVV_003586 [Alphaproteobacteria bacterium]|jgi:hypothetical protein